MVAEAGPERAGTIVPDSQRAELIARIHDTATMVVLAVTGGGVAAIGDLLTIPGASRTVLEATVPYAEAALVSLVGSPVVQSTSVATAAAMAVACRRRAAALAGPGTPVVGLACTAALVSDRPKRGEHRAHVGLCRDDAAEAEVWSLLLDKGARDRPGEDRLVSDLVLAVLAGACGLDAAGLALPALGDRDQLTGPVTPQSGGEPA
jgi:nicotinamide mononucleotide (NMN) deamidase PncC